MNPSHPATLPDSPGRVPASDPAPGAAANAEAPPLAGAAVAAGAPVAAGTRRRWLRPLLVALAALVALGLLFGGLLLWMGRAGDRPVAEVAIPAAGEPLAAKDVKRLESRLAAAGPRGLYIVIDTVENRLRLMKRDEVVLDARCSTGTGAVLQDPGSDRRWVFDTPKGVHRVQIKLKDPVWKKPDWAFIEEGKPVPKPNSQERFDFSALGDYGLYFGDGYLIHGTLYQRLLGRSVTHGCIRLGDDDLEALYRATPLGTPIYIY